MCSDVAPARDVAGQPSFHDLLAESTGDGEEHHHVHAESVTVTSEGTVDPEVLTDLLDNPPVGVYRMKGVVAVRHRSGSRNGVVNVVGSSVHVSPGSRDQSVGTGIGTAEVRGRLALALRPTSEVPAATALRRFQRP